MPSLQKDALSLFFFLIAITIAYWPSLHGPFLFDDFPNIIENPAIYITDLSFDSLKKAFWSNHSGLFKRPIPALSFALNYYFSLSVTETFLYKLTNLVIHLVNIIVVFLLAKRIWPFFIDKLYISYAALLTAVFWGLHPIQLTSVSYVVQRMTSLSTFFCFTGLYLFMVGRCRYQSNHDGSALMLSGLLVGLILGALCKENAVLIVPLFFLIEYILFDKNDIFFDKKLRYFYFLLVIIILSGIFFLFYLDILSGYKRRSFSLEQRILTQLRALIFYCYLIIFPDINSMSLFHDDFKLSLSIFNPSNTSAALLFWIIALCSAWKVKAKAPIFIFTLAWFLIGHALESTVIPLAMVFEHRNYLPSFGIIILVIYGLLKIPDAYKPYLIFLPLILFFATYARSMQWRSEPSFILSEVNNHPESATAQYLAGEMFLKKKQDLTQAYLHYYESARLKPNEVGYLIALFMVTPIKVINVLEENQQLVLVNHAKISERVQHHPLSAWGIRSLSNAAIYVTHDKATYEDYVDYVIAWLEAASANPYFSKQQKNHLLNGLYHIEMIYKKYDKAHDTLKKRKPYLNAADYFLMQADVRILLKDWIKAEDILTQAEIKYVHNPNVTDKIKKLRLAIQHKQKNSE